MLNIIRNLKKYWYFVILILALLFLQAYCDLSLPDYTSNLIDVGISNSGIEHAVPEYLTEGGFQEVRAFLTDAEKEDWDAAYMYWQGDRFYTLASTEDEVWGHLDEEFSQVIAIVYMMTSQQGAEFEGMDMTIDMTSDTLMSDIRGVFEDKLGSLGDSIIRSMAKQFAREQYGLCGIDMEQMQTDYLWSTGAKMLGMALIMSLAAILVGFLASRTAAGVGRDLRGEVFRKVIGFSNAELDQYSTASLITRSTNDVQQIQMVTVMILRMIIYAPILAIDGIINIRQYNSGMNWIIVLAVAMVLCLIAVLLIVSMPKLQERDCPGREQRVRRSETASVHRKGNCKAS